MEGSAEVILQKAKAAVESQGGNFSGDTQSGSFDVTVFGNTISGRYEVLNKQLEISITDKPMLVSCGMIESYLRGQLK